MRREGLSLVELSIVLALAGILGLALSYLLLSGVRTHGEAPLLQAQSLAQDLRDRLGKDLRSATSAGIATLSGQSPTASGFIVETQAGSGKVCVQYRLTASKTLERRSWTGSCTSPTGVFVNLLEPVLLPNASFCYDNLTNPSLVGLMDAPCDPVNLNGKGLTLRIGGKDYPFPPLVFSLRSG